VEEAKGVEEAEEEEYDTADGCSTEDVLLELAFQLSINLSTEQFVDGQPSF
jgi:hypothetical protein